MPTRDVLSLLSHPHVIPNLYCVIYSKMRFLFYLFGRDNSYQSTVRHCKPELAQQARFLGQLMVNW